jgi:hypothetical protein
MSKPLCKPRSVLRPAVLPMLVAVTLLLGACNRGPEPLPATELRIRINLLCTTCDDFLQCRASDSTDSFTLYRLREKSFWAQIATIWDYLIQSVHPKTSDRRPLTVYVEQNSQRRVLTAEATARVDMVSGLITLPESLIDMRDGAAASRCRGARATLGSVNFWGDRCPRQLDEWIRAVTTRGYCARFAALVDGGILRRCSRQ